MSLLIHIAEDEPRSARLLMQLLESQLGSGLVFDYSSTVKEAIDLLKINPPDLFFLDLELAGRSGFDVLEAHANRIFPVVVTTARKDLAYTCFRYGVQDYLLKPLNQQDLFEAIRRCKRLFPLPH